LEPLDLPCAYGPAGGRERVLPFWMARLTRFAQTIRPRLMSWASRASTSAAGVFQSIEIPKGHAAPTQVSILLGRSRADVASGLSAWREPFPESVSSRAGLGRWTRSGSASSYGAMPSAFKHAPGLILFEKETADASFEGPPDPIMVSPSERPGIPSCPWKCLGV